MLKKSFFTLPFYLQNILLFSLLIFFVSGCSFAPKPQKSKEFLPSQQREFEEVKKSYALFSRMEGIDAVLYLDKADFSVLIRKSFDDFSKKFADLKSEEFSKVTLGQMALHFSNQQLLSQMNFSFEVPALKLTLFGQLKAEHELKAGLDEFMLITKFDEIVLEGADDNEDFHKSADEKRRQITKAVKSFMHRMNLEIINTPLHIPVDMNILSGIKGKDIIRSIDYKVYSANPVKMQTKMKIYLPYIRQEGVVFLGSSQLKETRIEDDIGDDVVLLSAKLQKKIDLGLSETIGITLQNLQKHSAYYLSKAYLARQMNLALNVTDLRLINNFFLKIPEPNQNFSKKIYLFDKEGLPACEGVRKDCKEELISCDRNCSETYGVHQCISCEEINNPFEKVRCLSRYEACKSQQELHLYECHKEENRCALRNSELETQCEIENLERVAKCEEKKEKLLSAQEELVLAQLFFTFQVDSSYAVQRIRQITFDPELRHLETVRDIHISVDSRLKVEAKKSFADDIVCRLGITEPVLAHSEADYVTQKKELSLSMQRGDKGELMLKAISKPDFLSVHLKKRPYEKLLASKGFVLECDYQKMSMAAIAGEQLLNKKDIPYALNVILGEIELAFEEEELSFALLPVKLGDEFLLYPTMEEKAVGFSRQESFY